jgi:hypothetical protein
MTPPPTAFRSKDVCLHERDWQAFSDLLAAEYPQGRYYHGWKFDPLKRTRKSPPHLLISRSLSRLYRSSLRWDGWVWMVFDPHWQPVWKWEERFTSWTLISPVYPNVLLRMGHGIRRGGRGLGSEYVNDDIVYIDQGMIDVYCDPANKDHFKLARRFYRLFGKVATNKGLVEVRHPGPVVTPMDDNWLWVGHDAIRWAREDSNRLLTRHFGQDQYIGFRPADAGS